MCSSQEHISITNQEVSRWTHTNNKLIIQRSYRADRNCRKQAPRKNRRETSTTHCVDGVDPTGTGFRNKPTLIRGRTASRKLPRGRDTSRSILPSTRTHRRGHKRRRAGVFVSQGPNDQGHDESGGQPTDATRRRRGRARSSLFDVAFRDALSPSSRQR